MRYQIKLITNEVNKLKDNTTYVLIKDSFLSNWKQLDKDFPFDISLVAIEINNDKQEQIIFDNVENRSDFHYIDTQLGKTIKQDYAKDTNFNIKIMTRKNASRMYKKGGFKQ